MFYELKRERRTIAATKICDAIYWSFTGVVSQDNRNVDIYSMGQQFVTFFLALKIDSK